MTTLNMYKIIIKKKVLKSMVKMPNPMQEKLTLLLRDLKEKGPVLPGWPSFSRLGGNRFHCHLSRKWVACWKHESDTIIIEVYYAGSRENAPY
jgi:hypothetical protein